MHRSQPRTLWLLFFPLLFCALLLSLVVGAVSTPINEILEMPAGIFANAESSSQALTRQIVFQLRLPRALLAGLLGALLGISGAVMQGLFRNPLADPSLIGVTAGATAGAATAVTLMGMAVTVASHGELFSLSLLAMGAFTGGLIAVLLVYRLATSPFGTSVATMLLAGIAITALAGSYSSLLEYLADNTTLRRISVWRMGGLAGATYTHCVFAFVLFFAVMLVFPRYARSLNALLLGESEARHLGIDVQRMKSWLVLWVALAVGVAVSLAGVIAFVGLVVPHIVRLLTGPDHRQLIPLSALLGALLLVCADILARTVFAPAELPVGIITSALGAPFFISLLRRQRQWQ